MPVQHRDDRLAQAGERIEGAMAVADPGAAEFERRMGCPGFDIAAGAERLIALAGEDDDADIRLRLDQRRGAL